MPLYGVLLLLVVHVLTQLVSLAIGGSASTEMTGKQQVGLQLDIWLMPAVLFFVLYWVCKRLSGRATMPNILWVMVWSQLPVIILSLISLPLEFAGLGISEPLLSNKIVTQNGRLLIDPPVPQFNPSAMLFFIISTVLLLWSFQILLSGIAAVEQVSMKRAMWFLTVAMIALMVIRLPVTLILGDRDLLDFLGLKGILELQ